jgi:type I restriction enzyme S subunit
MNSSWPEVPFSALFAEPSRNGLMRPKRVRGTGSPMVNMGEVFAHSRITSEIEMELVPLSATERDLYHLQQGDLLFARQSLVASGAGKCVLVKNLASLTTFESHLIRVRLRDDLDPAFYYYFFASPRGKASVQSIVMQVAAAGIRSSELGQLRVPLPDPGSQQRIAGILSAYDDLIDNCERRIRVLDDMARALYREWFVDFRYPGHQNIPVIDSPLGPIPRGWRVGNLGELTTKIGSGATPRGGKEAYKTEGVALIRSMNIYNDRFEYNELARIDDDQARQLENVTVERGDVLLNITGASVARCAMAPDDALPARVNQHVAILRADARRCDPYFLLATINASGTKDRLLVIAQGGATREALTKETLTRFELVLPPVALIRSYGRRARVAGELTARVRSQVQSLRLARDLLLPRLLSGDLAVGGP